MLDGAVSVVAVAAPVVAVSVVVAIIVVVAGEVEVDVVVVSETNRFIASCCCLSHFVPARPLNAGGLEDATAILLLFGRLGILGTFIAGGGDS